MKKSGCLETLKQELDLKELLVDAEGCGDFVFPPDNPPNERVRAPKGSQLSERRWKLQQRWWPRGFKNPVTHYTSTKLHQTPQWFSCLLMRKTNNDNELAYSYTSTGSLSWTHKLTKGWGIQCLAWERLLLYRYKHSPYLFCYLALTAGWAGTTMEMETSSTGTQLTSKFRQQTLVLSSSWSNLREGKSKITHLKMSRTQFYYGPQYKGTFVSRWYFCLVKMAELLQISHWQSLQTCVPMAFSPAPSHQRTPATAQRAVHYNCAKLHHIQSSYQAVITSATRRHTIKSLSL